jgi:hypothetical protein
LRQACDGVEAARAPTGARRRVAWQVLDGSAVGAYLSRPVRRGELLAVLERVCAPHDLAATA